MRGFNRSRFLVFGILPALNAVALLIYGLEISTAGSYGEGETIPALVVIVGLCLLLTVVAAFRRGRDLGWNIPVAIAIAIASLAFVPFGLVLLAYLAFAKGAPDASANEMPRGMGLPSIMLAAVVLAAPWVVLRIMAAIYEL